jgi:hypothetical protein
VPFWKKLKNNKKKDDALENKTYKGFGENIKIDFPWKNC